jgi:hypothetical protein
MAVGNWIVTVKCQHCNTVYQMEKFNKVSVGQTTTPNPGLKCPGCQRSTPAQIVAVAKE